MMFGFNHESFYFCPDKQKYYLDSQINVGRKRLTKNEIFAVSEFISENPKIEFRLTNHVFERLKGRMGWSQKYAKDTLGKNRSIELSLSDSIVEPAKDGWKIHLEGLGKFVVVQDKKTGVWIAVTFYHA